MGSGQPDALPAKLPILILTDDEILTQCLVGRLSTANYEVYVTSHLEKLSALLVQHPFRALLCDVQIDGDRGLNLLRAYSMTLHRRGTSIIMLSSNPGHNVLSREMGADFFLPKPVSVITLLQVLAHLAAPGCS